MYTFPPLPSLNDAVAAEEASSRGKVSPAWQCKLSLPAQHCASSSTNYNVSLAEASVMSTFSVCFCCHIDERHRCMICENVSKIEEKGYLYKV